MMESMNIYQAACRVMQTRSYVLVRPSRSKEPGMYDVCGDWVGPEPEAGQRPSKRARRPSGYTLLDVMTAQVLKAVYEALSAPSQVKFLNFPLARLVAVAYKAVEKS